MARAIRFILLSAVSLILGALLASCAPTVRYYDTLEVAPLRVCSDPEPAENEGSKPKDNKSKCPRSEIAKAYEDLDPAVTIGLFAEGVKQQKNEPKTIAILGEEAIAAIVAQVKPQDPEAAAKLLATPIVAEPSGDADRPAGPKTGKVKLTFVIATEYFQPADRLVEAVLTAKISPGWEFVGWSDLKARRSDTKIAAIQDGSSQNIGGKGEVSAYGLPVTLDSPFEFSQGQTRQINRDLLYDVVEYIPDVTGESAHLRLFAPFPQSNIAGEYQIEAEIRQVPERLAYLNQQREQKIQQLFKTDTPYYNNKTIPACLHVSLQYVARHVRHTFRGGYRTAREDDDDVALVVARNDELPESDKTDDLEELELCNNVSPYASGRERSKLKTASVSKFGISVVQQLEEIDLNYAPLKTVSRSKETPGIGAPSTRYFDGCVYAQFTEGGPWVLVSC